MKTRGYFITLEGIDGCGKSTQAELLKRNLIEFDMPYISVREPGDTAVGEEIRELLLNKYYSLTLQAELHLYMAARSELTEQVILPGLIAGKIILCDRFTDSTLAYQGYGGGADLKKIRLLNRQATGGVSPDLTVLLDLPVEDAAVRRGAASDRMESMDFRYHQRVRNGYLKIARQDPERVFVIDASTDKTHQGHLIWKLVQNLMNKPVHMRNYYYDY